MTAAPELWLAPMEGLLDHRLRDALTRLDRNLTGRSALTLCVSEFIRVTDQRLPDRVFYRVVPEALTDWRTPAGIPVRPQLLGSDPHALAWNARRLAELGAPGVDLNFGCPARIVNRHGGGAALLDEPERLHRIARTVRAALPPDCPLSAKMRLGLADGQLALTNALALTEGGVDILVVHARTRDQGYRPPVHWSDLAPIARAIPIPLIANGDIRLPADGARCRADAGTPHLMIGRGMVANPALAQALLTPLAGMAPARPEHTAAQPLDWTVLHHSIRQYWLATAEGVPTRHRAGRIKQWLHHLRSHWPEAAALWERLRTENHPLAIDQLLG